ncbi:hypothetical protein X760_14490 [Mesorhizobium sp. LSHC422A00]|nr:hypothetical protein X770_29045 [Mesorhizobium sp. LSJC269B00]ESX47239.1 hypothetical protein X762_19035 [Mesorhizobium sp. LSHC426A00]ESX60508.1 hypothetical protein X760_14490 [Mesorhizobium sp. LSHC422A00]ESX71512.1 hypothetical protein X758_15700 [Mesorhizobium sp. LSHC416B00]ESX88113.1 hypothetical protein X754_27550 [Mesorhizobium sp. LNJC403B00]ESZ02958.1 hypothetical protein X736_28465 [Mesorhizobium sp. L2C089B000]
MLQDKPEVPASPTEPPVATRAFGPLGSKLPEGPRIHFNPRPTRQRALRRLMRRLETIQTKAMNSAACSVEISPEFITASFVIGVPATVPMPPTTNAAMLILKYQDRVVDLMLIFVGAGCSRWDDCAASL